MRKKELERDINELSAIIDSHAVILLMLASSGMDRADFVRDYPGEIRSELTPADVNKWSQRSGIERYVAVISEALHHLTPQTERMLAETDESLDWKGLKSYRNRPSHQYDSVSFEVVWEIIAELPPYVKAAESVRAELIEAFTLGEYER